MENRIEHITKATAKSYINDGYKLKKKKKKKNCQVAIYYIKHSNGNNIKIVGDTIERKINIYLNGKLNKTISL